MALGLLYRDGDLHAQVTFRLPRNKGFDLWWATDTSCYCDCSALRPHRGSALTTSSRFTSIDELFTSRSTTFSPTQNSHTLGSVGRTRLVSTWRCFHLYSNQIFSGTN
jgi:hypothetical protein